MPDAATNFSSAIDYQALGDRLRAYRIGASLLAEDVAEQLGVSRAVVYRMEKGEIVKIETLERLAQLLGTSMATLLGVEVEYYGTVLGLMERMRQLEQSSERIIAHFEPISLLLSATCARCCSRPRRARRARGRGRPTSRRCCASWPSARPSSRRGARTS